jgi:hypothetical protein
VSGAFSFDSGHGLGKQSGRDSESIAHLEQRARNAIETSAGRTLEDRDWIQMKGKLAELYAILRDWEKQTTNRPQESESSTGIRKQLMHGATHAYNRRHESKVKKSARLRARQTRRYCPTEGDHQGATFGNGAEGRQGPLEP